MLYPQKINAKNMDLIIKISIIISVFLGIFLVFLNRMTTPNIHWAGLCNAGIIYIWVTVLYSINKNINIAGHVLIQTIAISLLTVYIDYKTGFKAWSVNLSIPIIIIIANITMLILTIISHKKYIKYAVYQLLIVIVSTIPIFLVYENLVQDKTLSIIATTISGVNLILSLSLSAKDIKEVIVRKFHIQKRNGKMKNIKDYNLEELKEELKSIGEKPFRAEQIFKWVYQDKVKSFDDMTNLSLELREKLKENYTICNFKILKKQESSDGTKKYLFDVLDGNAIETVLMSYHHGYSICVSSQIGCKMGCKFCASTGIKFVRSLTSGEIVEQILAVEQDENIRISNIVFMGIGEPLDNFDNVINAVKIINNPKGLNIGARHISISTSGLVPMIYKLAEQNTQCTLSISLHATTNEKRSSMMPVNNAYNIEELIQACKDYIKVTNRRISFEYALAKDNNDNLEDAKRLVKLLKGMLCHVNLIPINKIENGEYTKSSNENIIKFRDYLNDHGIVATIRRELGSDIDAACGQLRRKNLKEEK